MTPAGAERGILLTIAPSAEVAADLPTLLRVALDSEQVGAGRLHLPADLAEPESTIRALRANSGLVVTCDPGGVMASCCDPIGPLFADVAVGPGDPADLLSAVAAVAAEARSSGREVSVFGRAGAALPVALAAIAGGLHLRVGTADAVGRSEGHVGTAPPSAQPDVALIARAAGVARIAGRPPVRGAAAAALIHRR